MNMTTRFASMAALAALLFAATAARAAGPAADSAPMRLDLRESPRLAADGESFALAYSPRWGGAASCSIAADGNRLLSNATEAGTLPWTARGVGRHALSFSAGSLAYEAAFTVLDENSIAIDSSRLQSNATWRAGVTWIVTTPLAIPSGLTLTIEPGAVVKFMDGAGLTVESGGACIARGAVFTHIADDTAGGDTMMDGDGTAPVMGRYSIAGSVTDDDATEYRYMPPQTLSSSISSDTRLRGYRCYIVSNSVTVASGATLTLQPGTVLKFNTGCQMTVNGTLAALGTRASPVVFTSLKDDAHGGDANGDGEKTRPNGGDWNGLWISGRADFAYAELMCSGNGNERGIVQVQSGGVLTMTGCTVAHALNDGIWNWGGSISVTNTVFTDLGWATAPYRGSRNEYVNCVFHGNDVGLCYWSHWTGAPTYRNCVFANCAHGWCELASGSYGDPPSGVTVANSCFHNPDGYRLQSTALEGKNGNIWGDPLFLDPENGDFRIAANSPCVDAADSSAAPATDYYGQPRMDVKRVADTGIPNADGVCADIGLYEVPGTASVPLPDLAVLRVAVSGDGVLRAGDEITVTYVVTNRGPAAATGLVRDAFRFVGADAATAGLTADAGQAMQTYSLPAGGDAAAVTARIRIPAAKPGEWRIAVTANAERDIFETATANNSAESSGSVGVALPAATAGGAAVSVDVPAGGSAGVELAGLPAAGGAVVADALPAGMRLVVAVGYIPDAERFDAEGVLLADGRTAAFVPAHGAGEAVYALLVDESGVTAATVRLSAVASAAGLVVAKPADVAVTKRGAHVTAELVLPATVRDGRVYAVWAEYANDGDEDAPLPVFSVSRTAGGATFGTSPKGPFTAEALPLAGLAPSAPRGWLKPGEKGRVPFYLLSSGQMAVKLSVVTDDSSAAYLNGFASAAEWRAGMAAAATRLAARGGADPDFSAILAQALNEKRGAGGAALCGTLRHAATGEPLSGFAMALVATNDQAVAAAATTDAKGEFVLATTLAGDYTVRVQGAQGWTDGVWRLDGEDAGGVRIEALPLGSVSGAAGIGEAFEAASGAVVALDDLSTPALDDYSCETDDTGRYKFDSLADGDYELRLYPFRGWCTVSTGAFVVSNGAAVVRSLSYGTRGAVVSGVLTDADTGLAVTNAAVGLASAESGEALAAEPDGAGRFRFDGVAPGRYAVKVVGGGWEAVTPDWVEIAAGEEALALDVAARPQAAFAPSRPLGMAPHTTDFRIYADIIDPEWDFDGDGTADSTEAFPSHSYEAAGTYQATLSYTDGGGVRRTCSRQVEVVEEFENKLAANGVLLASGGAIRPLAVETNRLAVSGASAAGWTAGTVVGMEDGPLGGFILRILSAPRAVSGGYEFDAEPATLDDLFEEYWSETEFSFEGESLQAAFSASAKAAVAADAVASAASGTARKAAPSIEEFSIVIDEVKPFEVRFGGSGTGIAQTHEPIEGSRVCYRRNGHSVESMQIRNSYVATLPISLAVKGAGEKEIKSKKPFSKWGNISGPHIPGPFGIHLSIQLDWNVTFSISASGTLGTLFSVTAFTEEELRREDGEEERSVLDWGVSSPEFKVTSLSGAIDAEVDASVAIGVYASWLRVLGRAGIAVKVGATAGLEQELVWSLEDGEADSKFKLTSSLYGNLEASWKWLDVATAKKHAKDLTNKISWDGEAWLGCLGFKTEGTGLSPRFRKKNPEMVAEGFLLGLLDGMEVTARDPKWDFGDGGTGSGDVVAHTYAKEGEYPVTLSAWCAFPTSFFSLGNPFAKKVVMPVRVFDDKPPEPQETADEERRTPQQSCDPNEMDGPEGVGAERALLPGEGATYTIYFENQTNATADAQQVLVDTSLSPQLDWSSFEMLEVVFGDQADAGLAGKANGTSTVDFGDKGLKVKTTVQRDAGNGVVSWNLRIWDPDREDYNYWPADDSGFLPPNDPETHCGEGHITYRVKVREDAEPGARIDASATIVFDYNDPIETDPSWWNTVGKAEDPLPVWRFYSKNYKGHFFTISEEEKEGLIAGNPNWKFEGTAYLAFTNQVDGTVPLYRFYSKGYRGHFFTIDAAEAETVKTNPNWKYEGIAYYVHPDEVEGSVPVFRFWSKGYRHHFYTTNEAEKDTLIATNPNWKYEGIAFYALPEAPDTRSAKASKKASSVPSGGAGSGGGAGPQPHAEFAEFAVVESHAEFAECAECKAETPFPRGGDSDGAAFAPWALVALPRGVPVVTNGITEIGGAVLETRGDAPDGGDLESHAEFAEYAEFSSHAEYAEYAEDSSHAEFAEYAEARSPGGAVGLRLSLPMGMWNARLWSAVEGPLEDEEAEGEFDFSIPATGVWHWLRVGGGEGSDPDAFSIWLRAGRE